MSVPHTVMPSLQFRRDDDFWRPRTKTSDAIRGQNITRAGTHNRQLVLHHIRAKGPVSRVDLAALTGLTQPAVFKISKDLLEEGLINCTVQRDGSRGQPSSFLTINPDAAYAIGLNVDRTHIAFVVLDFGGNVREAVRQEVPCPSPTDVKEVLAKFYKASLKKYSRRSGDFVGIGLSIPNDFAKNTDANFSILWRAVSLENLFTDITSLPVIVEDDAAAASIGEMVFGAGLDVDTFIYLHIGVGLGAGLVVNRRHIRGSHGRSGELGYLPRINPFRTSKSVMGKTIEEVVSIDGFLAAFRAAGLSIQTASDLDFDGPVVQTTLTEWLGAAADLLYLPLLSTMCFVDPDAIFLGGHLPPFVTEQLSLEITKRLSLNIGANWPENAVRSGKVVRNAAAVGAGVIAFREFWDRDLRN